MKFTKVLLVALLSYSVTGSAVPNQLAARGYIGQQCHGGIGTCEYASYCSSLGGTSNPANLCPGPQDVQCCEYVPCRSDTGICESRELCAYSLDSSPICPGGNDFQCCYIRGIS